MNFTKTFLGAGALTGAIALSLFAGVANAAAPRQAQTPGTTAAPNTPHPIRVMGRVNSVGSNSLTLTVRGGNTATVNVNDNTWILAEQNGSCTQGTLSDLQTGRPIAVAGMTTNQPGVINARTVAQCRAGLAALPAQKPAVAALAKHVAAGTVKSVNGSTITITNAKGNDVTLNTTANTVVLNKGFQSVSSLKVGDKVQVFGRPDKTAGGAQTPASRTLTAWAVRVDNGATQLMVGRVQSVNGNTVTLKTPAHKDGIAVTLGSSTGYKAVTVANGQPSIGNATQADVKASSNLIVEGVLSSDGKTLTANAVIILPQGKNK